MPLFRRFAYVLSLGLALSIGTWGALGAEDPGEALREAARAGELARIEALLAAGAPVDAPARYGQTPLYYAAEKGHLVAAKRLVEAGANVNAQDEFFDASALEIALQGGHVELARYLLAHGAEDADAALVMAIERDDLELARAALATGLIEPLDLTAARREVGGDAKPKLRELLAAATAKPRQRPPYKAAPERLSILAGRYREGSGTEVTVAVRGEGLGLTFPGETEKLLAPVAKDRFDSADGNLSMVFGGRGGLVEWARVNRGGEVSFFGVVTAEPTQLRSAAKEGAETKGEAAPAAAPRPWPQFRGTQASGVGDGQGAPAAWDVAAGQGVRFKTPIPGIGLSSPIVWGDRIFLTTAVSGKGDATIRTGLYGDPSSVDDLSEHSFRLYALDAASGRVIWEREVYRGAPKVRRHLKSSLANATPATDGERVVVLFGAIGKLAAYGFDGKVIWQRDIGVLDCNDPQSGSAEWGHASSPILYGDLVLIQGDRRKDSFLAAYRLATGEEVWRMAREEPSTWGTPNILPAASGDELVANGPTIRAYDPRGVLTSYRAETGEQLSQIRLSNAGVSISASPVAADGRLYIASEAGDVYVLRAGPEPELLAVQPMEEAVMSTPAISGGLLVVRTLKHVFGLSQPAGESRGAQ